MSLDRFEVVCGCSNAVEPSICFALDLDSKQSGPLAPLDEEGNVGIGEISVHNIISPAPTFGVL
jgi:hypothetical protein